MLGDTHTGKTSLVLRFVEGHYKENRNATVGAFFLTKRLTLDSMTCKLLLWDTAGQEQFQKLAVTYYQQAAAAIICYDLSGSIEDQIPKLQGWLDQVQQNISSQSDNRIVLCVAACKSDLPATPGIEDEARYVADRYGALYVKTSAKNDTNVTDVFIRTTESVLQCQHDSATGRGRPIPVTMGGTSLRNRSFSPTNHHNKKSVSGNSGQTGSSPFRNSNSRNASSAGNLLSPKKSPQHMSPGRKNGGGGGGPRPNNYNDTDSSSHADDSHDNLDDDGNPVEISSAPKIMCDNGMLVCGEGTGSECTIL